MQPMNSCISPICLPAGAMHASVDYTRMRNVSVRLTKWDLCIRRVASCTADYGDYGPASFTCPSRMRRLNLPSSEGTQKTCVSQSLLPMVSRLKTFTSLLNGFA